MTLNNFIEAFSEDIDVFAIDESISESRIKEIEGSMLAIAGLVQDTCPDSNITYDFIPNIKPESLKIKIITDEGDWVETNSNQFLGCIKYADEFKTIPLSSDKMQIEIIFARLS